MSGGRLVLFRTVKLRTDVANLLLAVQEAEGLPSMSDAVAVMALAYLRSKPACLAKIQRQIEVQEDVVEQRVIRFRSRK
jgi:hypothetical protein